MSKKSESLFDFCQKNRVDNLLNEWDIEKNKPITPFDIAAHSGRLVWWRCRRNHSWRTAVRTRSAGRGCPLCGKNGVIPGENDLATTYPELVKEWDYEKNRPYLPQNVKAGGKRRFWWRCKQGHLWQTSVAMRIAGMRCPYCADAAASGGFVSLASERPDLATEWDEKKNKLITPSDISINSRRPSWWNCRNGHSYRACIRSRVEDDLGCPYCSGRKVVSGWNDLATLRPELAAQWDVEKNRPYFRAESISIRSAQKVWWRCPNGHSYQATVKNRVNGQSTCPYCAGRKKLPDEDNGET